MSRWDQGGSAVMGRSRPRTAAPATGDRNNSVALGAEANGLQNSMLLMQFRQFCAELLAMRNLLEGGGAAVTLAPDAMAAAGAVPAPTPTEAAVAAAEAAIAAAQADAAARIAKVMGTPPPADAAPVDAALPSASSLQSAEVEEMRGRLLALIEQQTHQTMTLGGSFGIGRLREAQYVMAALGDEVILNARWAGKNKWRLLEEDLFHSHASGELFFTKLDALLKMGEAGSIELAAVFFQALALDFRGRYRNHDPAHQIERYRRQLFLRMFHTTPEAVVRSSITSQAYDSTATGEEIRKLPNPYRWWSAVAAVLVVWLVVSFIVWENLTLGLSQQLQRIENYTHRGSGPLAP